MSHSLSHSEDRLQAALDLIASKRPARKRRSRNDPRFDAINQRPDPYRNSAPKRSNPWASKSSASNRHKRK